MEEKANGLSISRGGGEGAETAETLCASSYLLRRCVDQIDPKGKLFDPNRQAKIHFSL
jgi:hypothetical protein